MFVNKIGVGSSSKAFKGYQHEINSVGTEVMRFNYPHNYKNENEGCFVEVFKVRKNPKAYAGYEVIDRANPIYTFKIEEQGTVVDIENVANLDPEEAFAYRIRLGKDNYRPDSGVVIHEGYTLVTRDGTTPLVQGSAYITMKDSHYPGVKREGFNSEKPGKIYFDIKAQKEAEDTARTYSNKFGGSLAGLIYDLPKLRDIGYKTIVTTPIAGGDDVSYHGYWNKNNMQIAGSDDIDSFTMFVEKLFQNGLKFVFDGTFTSEGLEGIHFQYATRWADKDPASYYWFRMDGINNKPLGYGVVPRNKENLRHRVINPPALYEQDENGNIKIVQNKDYDVNKETYLQIYDASQVSDEQLQKLDEPIRVYENTRSEDRLAINSHSDTVISYVLEVDPKEYEKRLEVVKEFNETSSMPVKVNSPDGTILLAQFSNFRITLNSEGMVEWDANVGLAKKRHFVSGYDEKILQSITDPTEREYVRNLMIRGAYESIDMDIQAAEYWTETVKDIINLRTARTLANVKSHNDIVKLIKEYRLPDEAYLTEEAVKNIISGRYNLEAKGVEPKDDVTVKSLMKLPLDALELGENTVGVLSMPYFMNRATSKDTLGMTRFELMQEDNPHLVDRYAKTYLAMNDIYTNELKDFTDAVVLKLDELTPEKLLDENGEYTEYGEYVVGQYARHIAKFALLKAIAGDDFNYKVLERGKIIYDYETLKSKTTLKQLGINAQNPDDEAEDLLNLMSKGLKTLNDNDAEVLAKAFGRQLKNTTTIGFRLAEAIYAKSGLGMDLRLDAAKDVMDMDSVRSLDNAMNDVWNNHLIPYWAAIKDAVKKHNRHACIIGEMTDVGDIMYKNFGTTDENALRNFDLGFESEKEAILRLNQDAGMTTEVAYSSFFTDLINIFSVDFEKGTDIGNIKKIREKLEVLIKTKSSDYMRNLFTFIGNHDKPRTIHYLALNMGLYYGGLSPYNEDGNLQRDDNGRWKNRWQREQALKMLSGKNELKDMPLELRLNVDNYDYVRTVSTRAVAMSSLIRETIADSFSKDLTQEQLKYIEKALANLTDGAYLGNGKGYSRQTIDIPELSSIEAAFEKVLQLAEKNHDLKLSASDRENLKGQVKALASKDEKIYNHLVLGDMTWVENKSLVESLLRGHKENEECKDVDFSKYDVYTANVASLLKDAFLNVRGDDAVTRTAVLDAIKDFVNEYDAKKVSAARAQLPFFETEENEMRKNAYGATDIQEAVKMVFNEAKYLAEKDRVEGFEKLFKDTEVLQAQIYQSATEPAVQKYAMMLTILSALFGMLAIYHGDEIVATGGENKAKNDYHKNREARKMSELYDKESPYRDYKLKAKALFDKVMGLRSQAGAEALNQGTLYLAHTSAGESIPAWLMQDGYGNMTVSIVNLSGLNHGHRHDYYADNDINDKNKAEKLGPDNLNVRSINPDNRFVPIIKKQEVDYIEFEGFNLPENLEFTNINPADKAVYVTKFFDGVTRLVRKADQFGTKFVMNGSTSENGVMILKRTVRKAISSRGRHINPQYNIVSNPQNLYAPALPVKQGEKLSLISK